MSTIKRQRLEKLDRAESDIPVVKQRPNTLKNEWIQTITLEQQQGSFDWIVIELYGFLKGVIAENGSVGFAREFKGKEGERVKLRCMLHFHKTLYVTCDFLILKTPTGVSITLGLGVYSATYIRYKIESGFVILMFPVSVLLSLIAINFPVQTRCIIWGTLAAFWIPYCTWKHFRNEKDLNVLRASAHNTITTAFYRWIEDIRAA